MRQRHISAIPPAGYLRATIAAVVNIPSVRTLRLRTLSADLLLHLASPFRTPSNGAAGRRSLALRRRLRAALRTNANPASAAPNLAVLDRGYSVPTGGH